MKFNKTAVLSVGARAAACAASFVIPVVLGGSALGMTGLAFWKSDGMAELLCVGLVLVGFVALAIWWLVLKQNSKVVCSSDGSCGCKSSTTTP